MQPDIIDLIRKNSADEAAFRRIIDALQAHTAETSQRERRFQIVLNTLEVGIFMTDGSGACVDANLGFQQLVGLRREALLGGGWLDAIHPDDRVAFDYHWRESTKQKTPFDMKIRFVNADGTPIWSRINMTPLHDQGQLLGYFATISDVVDPREQLSTTLQRRFQASQEVVQVEDVLICRFRPDTTLTYVNDVYCRYHGKQAEDIVGRSLLELLPVREHEWIHHLVDTLVENPRVLAHERHAATLEGQDRWQQWTQRAILDENGNVVEIEGIGRDTTHLKMTEAALERSERQYRTLVSNLPGAAVVLYNWDLKITLADGPVLPALGFNRSKIEGVTIRDAMPPSIANELTPYLRMALTSRPMTLERTYRGRIYDVHMLPIVDNEGVVLSGMVVAQDVTESRQAELYLRRVLNGLFTYAGVLRPDGTILEVNMTALDGSSLSLEDVRDKPFEQTYWWSYSPQAQAQLHEAIQQAAAGKPVRYDTEIRLDEDVYMAVDFNLMPIFDEQGTVTHLVPSALDITERKRFEAERETLIDELEAFAHTVAHDLKNPMNVVSVYTGLLRDKANLEDKHEAWATIVLETVHEMHRIINELLRLAAIRHQATLDLEPIEMSEVVQGVLQRRLFKAVEDAQAEIVLPDTWPVAMGYTPWLEEVWANYINNALKYGGKPPHIELGATIISDEAVQYWVKDNGEGLDEKEQEQLFKSFSRLDRSGQMGHGLGLSIVKRIVKRLGGQVGVESAIGMGSTFWFTLPTQLP